MLAFALALLVAACGSSDATEPSATIPAAHLALDSMSGTRSCTQDGPFTFCSNSYTAHNLGPGCAANVGATCVERLSTVTSTYAWSLPAGTVLRPGQAFTMTCTSAPIMESIGSILISASFDFASVACPASQPSN